MSDGFKLRSPNLDEMIKEDVLDNNKQPTFFDVLYTK